MLSMYSKLKLIEATEYKLDGMLQDPLPSNVSFGLEAYAFPRQSYKTFNVQQAIRDSQPADLSPLMRSMLEQYLLTLDP